MTAPHKVGDESADMRLDRWFLQNYPHLTKGAIEKLLRSGQVRINKGRKRGDYRLQAGDEIRIPPQLSHASEVAPPRRHELSPGDKRKWQQRLPDMILYEDDDIIAINKPAGLAVQGGSKIFMHVDKLLPLLARGDEVPRLVHRLDKDTSGVLLLAKHRRAAESLTADFKARRIMKLYWALVSGTPKNASGRIAVSVAKKKHGEHERMQAESGGNMAETLYRNLQHCNGVSWLACSPLTGRTHQIRLHLSHIGTPILGDRKYGGATACTIGNETLRRIYLHARSIQYRDITITAPTDADFSKRLKQWGFSTDISHKNNFLT